MVASNKDEFLQNMDAFVENGIWQSIIFEVMVSPEDDTDALDAIKHIVQAPVEQYSLKKDIKTKIKSTIGTEKIKAIKTLLS